MSGHGSLDRRALTLAALTVLASAIGTARAAPIRTASPGTGAVEGFSFVERLITGDESGGGERLGTTVAWSELRYTPSARWQVGVRVPFTLAQTVRTSGLGEASRSGLSDVWTAAKFRFFRQVGRWWDQQAAAELSVKLPTGASNAPVDPRWPLQNQRDAQLGTGSTDARLDLSYQRGHGRFVQAADASYRKNGRGAAGYTAGDEARLDLDAEYILLPRGYRVPGHELFTLLEATAVHKEADEHAGLVIPPTRRTELLVAPGLEYVATDQLALELSLQVPVAARVPAGGRRSRANLLLDLHYAF
jgi:hypothetical protein